MVDEKPIAVDHARESIRDPPTAAHRPAEIDEPMLLEAVAFPGGEVEPMAEAFVEAYARLGMNEDEVYSLFVRHVYFGTHTHFEKNGTEATKRLIRRVLTRTRICRHTDAKSEA